MPDEQPTGTPTATAPVEATAPAPETAPEAPPAAPAAVPPPAESADSRPAWLRALDEAPADELARHPKVAGIIGSRQAAAKEKWEADQKAKIEADAIEAANADLKRLAKDDPLAFAEKWLSNTERKTLADEADRQAGETRRAWATRITESYRDHVPEFAQMTTDDHTRLATAMAGKDDDAALAAFNAEVAAIVADKRAAVRVAEAEKSAAEAHDTRLAKALAAEREAITKQVRADILKEMGQPDLARPRTATPSRQVDVLDWRDPKWSESYERDVLGR